MIAPTSHTVDLRDFLGEISILPFRLLLETPGVEATVPMLRGAWGAALHDLDREAYHAVFDPPDAEATPPGYLFRPAPPDPRFAPAVDWFLFGAALEHEVTLRRAWELTAQRGLGPRRRPLTIRAVVALGPAGQLRPVAEFANHVAEFVRIPKTAEDGHARTLASPAPLEILTNSATARTRASPATGHAWTLAEAAWPAANPHAACSLVFPAPLRLRRQGRLIDEPTLADLVVAACRRVGAFLPGERRGDWQAQTPRWIEIARATPQRPWAGMRLDLHRYSARQSVELDLRGVAGRLDLPEGPGELAPLLAAAAWLHLGKGTVMGLGQMEVVRGDG